MLSQPELKFHLPEYPLTKLMINSLTKSNPNQLKNPLSISFKFQKTMFFYIILVK